MKRLISTLLLGSAPLFYHSVAVAGGSETQTSMKKPHVFKSIEDQVSYASSMLAKQLQLGETAVSQLKAVPVTWRSGAMGCPEAGKNYTQALVPGTLIVLEVDGEQYRFHASSNGEPFLCPYSQAEEPMNQAADR